MQSIANNGYSASQVLARSTGAQRAWHFPLAILDYAFRFTGYLADGAIRQSSYSLDADSSPINAVYTATARKEVIEAYDLPNTYFRPEVWIYMGADVPAGTNDGDPFAKFPQGIFRLTDMPDVADSIARHFIELTAHDLNELLEGDSLTNDLTINAGDVVTTKIKAVLDLSVIPVARRNVVDSTEVMRVPKTFVADTSAAEILPGAVNNVTAPTFPAGTSLLTVLHALCEEIGYVHYFDNAGVLNVRPWRDPAIASLDIEYTDSGEDTIFPEARRNRDIFGLPNTLILRSQSTETAPELTSTVSLTNPSSPISTATLKAPDGTPLIRNRVEGGIEATSQSVLDKKAQKRALEIWTVPETYEMGTRIKPWHEYEDLIGITREDMGFYQERFQIRRIGWSYELGRMNWTLRRSISLT